MWRTSNDYIASGNSRFRKQIDPHSTRKTKWTKHKHTHTHTHTHNKEKKYLTWRSWPVFVILIVIIYWILILCIVFIIKLDNIHFLKFMIEVISNLVIAYWSHFKWNWIWIVNHNKYFNKKMRNYPWISELNWCVQFLIGDWKTVVIVREIGNAVNWNCHLFSVSLNFQLSFTTCSTLFCEYFKNLISMVRSDELHINYCLIHNKMLIWLSYPTNKY